MGSRNTFVTSFIYSPDAILVVEKALHAIVGEGAYHFYGSEERDAGYFSGIITGDLPAKELNKLFEVIDAVFEEIGYVMDFDIAVIGDEYPKVLQRWDRYGDCSNAARRDDDTYSPPTIGDMINQLRVMGYSVIETHKIQPALMKVLQDMDAVKGE